MKFFLLNVILFISFKAAAINSYDLAEHKYCKNFNNAIERYACLTEHAVKGIQILFDNELSLQPEQITLLKAIEAMNIVQTIASSGRFSYLRSFNNFKVPTMDEQDLCLENAFGICGNHQYLFVQILKQIGVEARPVDLYFSFRGERMSHAAAEVKIAEKWVYFDVTWGSYWIHNPKDLFSIKSLEEVLKNDQMRITNTNSWYTVNTLKYGIPGVFAYLKAADLQILRNKGGEIAHQFNKNKEVDFSHRPNYFGKSDDLANLKIKLNGKIAGDAVIHIAGVGGDCNEALMKVGSKSYPLMTGKTIITISPNAIIEIQNKDENKSCYAVIAELKALDVEGAHKS